MAIQPLRFGSYYHIYNRGNNRENLFFEPRNYPYFLQLYAKHILPVAQTFAYCLLPNHYHFLIRTYTEEEQVELAQIGPISKIGPISPAEPSRAFNNMFIAYTRAVNLATGRTGALFERPFGRKLVAGDAHFRILVVYIHRNPQKHGLVADFRDWPHSSFGAFQSERPTHLQRVDLLERFGGIAAFNEAHMVEADERLIAGLIGEDAA